jgi:hypothetical protein
LLAIGLCESFSHELNASIQVTPTLIDPVLPAIPADAKRINMKSVNEVNYWCHTFRCTETRLRNAVLAVGFLVADVQIYLNR